MQRQTEPLRVLIPLKRRLGIVRVHRVARSINAVLISHPDLAHLGALPYAYASLGLVCPIYATLPVFNMGQVR